MNIFLREMKAYRRSLTIWCICMVFFVGAGMGKFETYQSQGQSLKEIIAQMPAVMRNILGFGNLDPTKMSGYFGMLFLFLLIILAVHAVILGEGIIAKEERDKTSEFLMAKPISRTVIITAKLFAAVVNVIIVNIVTAIFSIILTSYYGKGEPMTAEVIRMMAAMLILEFVFLFIGSGLASVSKHPKTTGSCASGVLLITFIISVAIDFNDKLSFLRVVTPFKYFMAEDIGNTGTLSIRPVFMSAAVILALGYVTYTFYDKKDLNV